MAHYGINRFGRVETVLFYPNGAGLDVRIRETKWTRGCMGSTFSFGTTNAACVEMTLENDVRIVQGTDWVVRIRESINGGYRTLYEQVLFVQDVTRNGKYMNIVLYGANAHQNMEQIFTYEDGVIHTWWDCLVRAAQNIGMVIYVLNPEIKEEMQANAMPLTSEFPRCYQWSVLQYTNRQVIGYIAGAFGLNVMEGAGSSYILELGNYADSTNEIVTAESYAVINGIQSDAYERRITKINVKTTSIDPDQQAYGTEEREISRQSLALSQDVTMEMENPFIDSMALRRIFDRYIDSGTKMFMKNASVNMKGDIWLVPYDRITIGSGVVHPYPVMSVTTTIKGGMTHQVTLTGTSSTDIVSCQSTTNSLSGNPVILQLQNQAAYTNRDYATFKSVTTDNLTSVNANITNLEADNVSIHGTLTSVSADLEELDSDNVTIHESLTVLENAKVTIEGELEAVSADITTISGELASYKTVVADEFRGQSATIQTISGDLASYKTVVAGQFTAQQADIDEVSGDLATFKSGDFGALSAKVGDISTLMFGSAVGSTVTTEFANSMVSVMGQSVIGDALIGSLSVSKLLSGDISTNKFRIISDSGKMLLSDNTMQISDGTRVRVQIGKDASNDYSINVWDTAGKLMFSKGGITENAVKSAIIRNDMVSDTANIDAKKLDIDSLFTEMNGSSQTIKASKVKLDAQEQTLDIAFTSMTTEVSTATETAQSASENASSAVETAQSASGTASTASQIAQTALSTANSANTNASTAISTANSASSVAGSASANASSAVETANTAKSAVDNLEVGGRNLLVLNTSINKANQICDLTHPNNDKNIIDLIRTSSGDSFSAFNFDYVVQNGEHTLSFEARNLSNTNVALHSIMFRENGGDWRSYVNKDITTTGNWEKYFFIFNSELSTSRQSQLILRPSSTGYEHIQYRNIKLEKGNKATDWTPAPEDTQNQIDTISTTVTAQGTSLKAVQGQIEAKVWQSDINTATGEINTQISEIQTHVGNISLTVAEVQADVADVDAKFTNYSTKAEVQVLSDSISQKVSKGDVINQINLSTEGVSIDASRINLNGVVTANNNFIINTDGSMQANAGTIGFWNINEDSLSYGSEKYGYLSLGRNKIFEMSTYDDTGAGYTYKAQDRQVELINRFVYGGVVKNRYRSLIQPDKLQMFDYGSTGSSDKNTTIDGNGITTPALNVGGRTFLSLNQEVVRSFTVNIGAVQISSGAPYSMNISSYLNNVEGSLAGVSLLQCWPHASWAFSCTVLTQGNDVYISTTYTQTYTVVLTVYYKTN